jgi:hypothetical protein
MRQMASSRWESVLRAHSGDRRLDQHGDDEARALSLVSDGRPADVSAHRGLAPLTAENGLTKPPGF